MLFKGLNGCASGLVKGRSTARERGLPKLFQALCPLCVSENAANCHLLTRAANKWPGRPLFLMCRGVPSSPVSYFLSTSCRPCTENTSINIFITKKTLQQQKKKKTQAIVRHCRDKNHGPATTLGAGRPILMKTSFPFYCLPRCGGEPWVTLWPGQLDQRWLSPWQGQPSRAGIPWESPESRPKLVPRPGPPGWGLDVGPTTLFGKKKKTLRES